MRPGRVNKSVARWVYNIAQRRDDAKFELVDVEDFNLPLLDEPVLLSMGITPSRSPESMGGKDRFHQCLRFANAWLGSRDSGRTEESVDNLSWLIHDQPN